MKKVISKIVLVLMVFLLVYSCTDDRDPILSNSSVASFKSAPSGSYTVTEVNLSNTFETFVIIPASYNIPTETMYQLEIAKAGTNFAEPKNLGGATSDLYIKVTFNQINTAALLLGAKNNEPFGMDVRIKSNIKNTTNYLYSSAVTFTITPFVAGPLYPYKDLYLIGNATAATWDNNANNGNMYPLEKDLANPNKYTYSGYFTSGGFKMVEVKGNWDKQYGKGSDGVLSTSGGSSDIGVSVSGYYKLSIDINALTYTFEQIPNPIAIYSQISIIGTVNGNWNNDTDLTQSSFDPHVWIAKNVTLNSGEFKFRANHDWGTSWGNNKEYFGFGSTANAPNIPLSTTWKYDIYFNDITGAYTLIPIF